MYDLNGKVALVTGAAGEHGIGRAIALRLAREGADVVVADLKVGGNERWGGLDAVVAQIEQMGCRSIRIVASVAAASDVERMTNDTLEMFGHLDILVNNAAAPAGPDRVPVVDLSEGVWDLVQEVNVKGTFLCSRAAARHMIERGVLFFQVCRHWVHPISGTGASTPQHQRQCHMSDADRHGTGLRYCLGAQAGRPDQ